MYMSTTPKGETKGVLAFVILVGQYCLVLNGVHRDAGHQGQQGTLALAQERFWWPMMAEDCCTIVRGCPTAEHLRERCLGLPCVKFGCTPHSSWCTWTTPV